jgi:UDP-2-acetamido-2,6-beta-L-arabino-hexul-4-ose reductase
MPVAYEPLRVVSDARGFVFEPLAANAFCFQKNAHIVVSLPGVVRGNHYHLKGQETIAVMGPALVRFREGEEIKDMEISQGEAYRFLFPPGVSHAIQNLSSQANVLMAFNTIEHDPRNPDVVGDKLL